MKFFPNVLLVIIPEELHLYKAFSRFANVYIYLSEHSRWHYFFHNLPGVLKVDYKLDYITSRFLGNVLNRPHNVWNYRFVNITPADFDLVFVTNSSVCRVDLKPFKNAIKAFWSVDCHLPKFFFNQLFSGNIKEYDIVFCSHKYCIEKFKEHNIKNVLWLPLAYDSDIYKPLGLKEEYDLAFVMTLTEERKNYLRIF